MKKILFGLLNGVLLLSLLIVIPINSAPPATAAVSDKCDGTSTQNTTKVTAQHGKIFYIDSGQGQNVDAAYVSYKVTNTSSSTAKSDIWVHLDSFVGGVVQLANTRDESQPIGAISASGSATAFFLLKASTSSTKAQSHVVHVYKGNPDLAGAQELYSCTYSFTKVAETIKAAANKVTSVVSTTVSKVGQTMTITVEGATGIVGAGNSTDGRVIWLSPAARSTWPTQALRLEGTSFDMWENPSRNAQHVANYPITDTLITTDLTAQSKYYYRSVYTFRIIGNAGSGVPISPLAQISSGTQMKHTDLSGTAITGGSLTVSPTTDLVVTKSLSGTTTYSGGTTTFTYSITLNNTAGASAVDVDLVTDSPDSQLSLVSSSATFNSSAISDPSASASDASKLIFSGPFTVPAASSRVISYRMTKSGCTSGAYSVTNSATAQIGSITIGSGARTYSQVAGSGTCGTTTVTPTVTDPVLTPSAITNPATGITTSAATLNASIDPEGTAGQSVSFLWGTSPTLTTSTEATLTASTNSTTSYAVSTSLSSLTSGTTYYFRIKLGEILGDILSFTTYEVPATPTVATTTASNFSAGSGSSILVQLNGSVDPNQVVNGVKARFKYVIQDDQTLSGHSCISSNRDAVSPGITTVPSASTYVQTQTDEAANGSAIYGDAVFTGSFATDATYMNSSGVTTVSLTENKYYCYQIIGYYNSSTADWATPIEGEWIPFYASVKTSQTITFPTISNQTLGVSPITLGATASSGLAVSYSSNSESVCTVAYDSGTATWKVTVLTAGYCSITASQAGNDSVSEAQPVTIVFQVTVTLTYAGNSSDGGSVPSAYTGGGEVVLASAGTMTKTGFTFSGWNIDGVSYLAGDKYNLTASKTATAIWKNTVTYDPRSGTVSPTSAQFTFGGTGLTLPTPTRDGYAFTGWYTAPTGGSNITSTYSPTDSITLYAQWAVVYTVTFNANGGTGAASVSTVTQASSGASVTLATKNTLALANSGFMGWASASSAGTFYAAGDSSYVPSNNHSLYAQWITTGAASSVVNTSATISGTSNLALTSPKFCYSATDPVSSFDVATCSPVNASGTYAGYSVGLTGLTASTTYHYQITGQISGTSYYGAVRTFSTAATYEVTYNVNGGTGSAPNAQTTSAGGSVTLNNGSGLSKSDSTFIGWSTSQNNGTVVSGSYTPSGSVLLYAQWITTTAASPVGSTTATLNGTASSTLTSPTFCYGTDSGLSGCTSGAASGTYTKSLTGLTPGTTYYFRVSGTVGGTIYSGGILSFTTTAAAPAVTTVAASDVLTTSATLNGTINANAASTATSFCWGTAIDLSGCTTVTATPSTVTGTSNTSISLSLTGLSESTLYYFRAIGINSVNTTNGNILSFTTSSSSVTAPVPVTTAASSVTTTTATLNGTMETGGASTTVIFEYCASTTSGCTSSSMPGSPSTASAGSVTGAGAIAVNSNITGLTAGTTYYFRVKGTNSNSSVYGGILSFTTTSLTNWSITATNASYTIGGSVPTLTGTASPSGGLSGSLTCEAYASADTGYATPITINSSLAAGTYVIRCQGSTAAGYATPTITNATLTVSSAAPTTYTITASAGSNGSISPSGSVTVNSGDNQSFTITANSGYEVNVLTVDSTTVTTVTTYTFSNVTANHSISVTFKAVVTGGRGNSGITPAATNKNVKIIVQKISVGNPGNTSGQTTTTSTTTTSTGTSTTTTTTTTGSSSNASSTGATAATGGQINALTNNSQSAQSNNNGAMVEAVNTTSTTSLIVDKNVPSSVAVERTSDNKISVQGINGWTGRVSVAVVDENDPSSVQSFIEVAINPLPVSKVIVNEINSIKDQKIEFSPSPSEVVKYQVLINNKVACESTTTSCALTQLVGPKSKVEIIAIGNDETRSIPEPLKIVYKKPIVALVVNFPVGSAALSSKYRADLRALAKVLVKEGFTRIQIDGHTDTQGVTIGYNNQVLSDARSRATKAYLAKLVPGLQFVTSANSYLEPAADNVTPEGQFTNRRAEVKVW